MTNHDPAPRAARRASQWANSVCGSQTSAPKTTRGGREHADDLRGHAVDDEARTNGVVSAAETRLPEAVADEGEPLPLLGLAAEKRRPRIGVTPSSVKTSADTRRSAACSVSPADLIVAETGSKTAMPSKRRLRSPLLDAA